MKSLPSSAVNRVPRLRGTAIACCLLGVCLARPSGAMTDPAPAQVAALIEQLNADDFEARQAATVELAEAGLAAVKPLAAAAGGDSHEVMWRAVESLRLIAYGEGRQAREAAITALRALSQSPSKPLATRAAAAVADYQAAIGKLAVTAFRKLGGRIIQNEQDGRVIHHVTIGPQYRGGVEGFAHLGRLDSMVTLTIQDGAIDDEALRHLRHHPGLYRLYLEKSGIVGPGLAHLATMPSLRHVSLRQSGLGDDAAAHLAEATQIEALGLDYTEVTNAALPHLRKLKRLKTLWLNFTKVNDRGLKDLAALEALERLELVGMRLTEPGGLAALKDLKNLRYLTCQHSALSVEACGELAMLPQVETLGLDATNVTDAHVEALAGMSGLKTLWLSETKITDKALNHLRAMTALRELHLEKTAATPDAVVELRKALPRLAVWPTLR